jgi:glycosyltransferase involved in cell wall biosynthesis/peptidoglycan/xylan/chitin deacetylase (PgdA/CDA1 family)
MNMNPVPLLSVVSPYAGGETLPHFLTSLTRQSLDPELFELLLIEDGDHDGTRILESSEARFAARVMPLNRPPGFVGHSAGLCRNVGARHARGRVLVFVDSDCILHPDCLQAHLGLIGESRGLAVCGAAKELPIYNHDLLLKVPPPTYEELAQSSLIDHRSESDDDVTPPTGDGWDYWYSLNASVRREDFLSVSGFDESGYRCHDMDLAYRLLQSGLRFEYSQAPEVIHIEHPRSITFRKEQMKGWLNLARQYPELRAFAEDRLIVLKRLLTTTLERCENKFQQITHNLPGIRVGYTWLLPPGTTEEEVTAHLNYVPYVAKDKQDLRYLNLRLHKNCWDYAVALPKAAATQPPLISVIIPTYNARDKIGRALLSVLLQTSQAFEIIVVDDASTDGTLREVVTFQTDQRVRVFSLRYNEGLSNALNAGLQQSQAPLIIQLDADDWLEATALESVIRALQSDEAVGAVYGDSIIHGSDGEVSASTGKQLTTPVEFLECTTPQAPRAYRKKTLLEVGGWNTADAFFGRYFDDRLILARIAEKYRVCHLPQKLYHIDESGDSLTRGQPLNFMAGKLAILWEQANRKGCLLSHTFNGRYLRAKFHPRRPTPVSSNWSIIIPFHRSAQQLKATVKSWLQSDLTTTAWEIIIVDDASGEPLDDLVVQDPSRVRVVRAEIRKGPAWARNAGAAAARHEMLFFSDSDHIVPTDVISSHERRHACTSAPAIVVGGVYGRRTFFSITPDCRVTHKQRLLELLKFDERFESVAGKLACGHEMTLVDADSCDNLWEQATKISIADQWYGEWARIFLRHGEDLEDYAHRWTRLNSGNISVKAETLRGLGGFDEYLTSMEDWELGARAQKMNVRIIPAPEAEPYHQVHPTDPDRPNKDRRAASFIRAKHEDLVDELLSRRENYRPPAALVIRHALADTDELPAEQTGQPPLPEYLAGGYCVLTFDDGPHALGTSLILETLERFSFKATFFFLGKEVEKYQDLCRRTAALGHEIGIHGWTHTEVERLTTTENLEMLARALDTVNRVAGIDVRYVRPPYGRLNESFVVAAESLGLTITGWDVSSDDWRALSKCDVIKNLAAEGIKNKIILFHDAAGDPAITIEALEWLLKSCSNFGIKAASLAECVTFRTLPSLKPMDINRWASDM